MKFVQNLIQRPLLAASLLALMGSVATPAFAGKTLDGIKSRGALNCGVNPSLPGFAAADSQGNWTGLDVDVCKAVAATVLNDAAKVKWTPLNATQRFAVLQAGEIDILSRNTTWTLNRDASLGLHFTGTTYYDGQGFMVTKKSKITSAKSLKGATVCVQSGTTTEKNLNDFSKVNKLNIKPVVFDTQEATNKAYFAGRCQAYTTDASGLASVRNKEATNPDDHVILPDLIGYGGSSKPEGIDYTLQHMLRAQRFWQVFICGRDISSFKWAVREREVDLIMNEILSQSQEMKVDFAAFTEVQLEEELTLNCRGLPTNGAGTNI